MTELDLTTVHKCCICDGDIEHHKTEEGKTYWTQGHNAQPIKEGQCCDDCNTMVVLPKKVCKHFKIIKEQRMKAIHKKNRNSRQTIYLQRN